MVDNHTVIYFIKEPHFITNCNVCYFSFIGRPFVKRFALCYRTVAMFVSLSCLSFPVCDVGALWPNGWTDQGETWFGMQVGSALATLC